MNTYKAVADRVIEMWIPIESDKLEEWISKQDEKIDELVKRNTELYGDDFHIKDDGYKKAMQSLIKAIKVMEDTSKVQNDQATDNQTKTTHEELAKIVDEEPSTSAERLLVFFLSRKEAEELLGDLAEDFLEFRVPKLGIRGAKLWYWKQVLSVLIAKLMDKLNLAKKVIGMFRT